MISKTIQGFLKLAAKELKFDSAELFANNFDTILIKASEIHIQSVNSLMSKSKDKTLMNKISDSMFIKINTKNIINS